jgi:hypothetical protein
MIFSDTKKQEQYGTKSGDLYSGGPMARV